MRSMKNDPDFGLDSRWSWITAVFSSACLFMGCLATRVIGVVYVGIITTFNVSREEASWPMTALDGAISIFSEYASRNRQVYTVKWDVKKAGRNMFSLPFVAFDRRHYFVRRDYVSSFEIIQAKT